MSARDHAGPPGTHTFSVGDKAMCLLGDGRWGYGTVVKMNRSGKRRTFFGVRFEDAPEPWMLERPMYFEAHEMRRIEEVDEPLTPEDLAEMDAARAEIAAGEGRYV